MAYSYSQLRRAVEAAEAREEERHIAARNQRLEASRAASGDDGTVSAAASPAKHSEAAEIAQLRTQLTQQQAKMGELLQGLNAEWQLEQGQLHKQIHQLRMQFAEAKATHEAQLRERDERDELHGQTTAAPPPSDELPSALVGQRCLAAELRLEELAAISARDVAAQHREAARVARAEVRTHLESLHEQAAAATEADARLVELQEESAAHQAQILELRTELASRPELPKASDWQELTAEDGRTYYWNTASGERTWDKPPELAAAGGGGAGGGGAARVPLSEAGQEELGELRAQNSKLLRQLAEASAKIRAAGAALAEQQQQVADAMSIGSTKVLQAAVHGWLHHVLNRSWRRWARVALDDAAGGGGGDGEGGGVGVGGSGSAGGLLASSSPSRRVTPAALRSQRLRSWLRGWEAGGAARALLSWREAARVLTGRRHLQLTRELMSSQQEQLEDALMLGAAMRLGGALTAANLVALPVAFALWRAIVHDPYRIPEAEAPTQLMSSARRRRSSSSSSYGGVGGGGGGAAARADHQTSQLLMQLEVEVQRANESMRMHGDVYGGASEAWTALYAQSKVLAAELDDERARGRQLRTDSLVLHSTLATELAQLEGATHGPPHPHSSHSSYPYARGGGGGALRAPLGHATPPANTAAAEREMALRSALEHAKLYAPPASGGGGGGRSGTAGGTTAGGGGGSGGLELQHELSAVRTEVETARASALQSQMVASAAAADVQRASTALGSEVAQLRAQLNAARSAAAREVQERRASAVRELRYGGAMDGEPARRAMQCASSLVLSKDWATTPLASTSSASAGGCAAASVAPSAVAASSAASAFGCASAATLQPPRPQLASATPSLAPRWAGGGAAALSWTGSQPATRASRASPPPRGPLALHSSLVWEATRVR